MSSKKIKTVESPTIESIHVKLKPVLGISPRAYVPAIWLLIFILIVFLFLVLPGIKKNGTYLTVWSLPSDSSVIVDGIRLGTSGDKVFVKHGSRNLVVRRAGFKAEKQKIEISGRIFASRLFPLQKQIVITLRPEDGYNHLSAGLRNFAGWAATGPEEGRYAIPPVLTHTARDLLQTGYQYTDNLPKAALPLSIDERQLSDILRSQF
ncbi:MAG: hypothetical protein KAH21_07560, partial [Spirochaetaceae bacterium]|nr:hypothetical protein [Spirochaetaceae bacterium]